MRNEEGFSLLELLVAVAIFSIAMLALASVSLTVVKGNNTSKKFTEASVLAQDTIEELRNSPFDLGADATLGTADDTIPSALTNANAVNDTDTAGETLFAGPDHYYQIDANGDEVVDGNGDKTVVDCAAVDCLSPSNRFLRRAWSIRDNEPVVNMKLIMVTVGWREGMSARYLTVTTAMQGE